MSAPSFEPTRLLCAGVVKDSLFREKILQFLKQRYTAVAPEMGVDVRLVAEVSKFMDRRDHNYHLILSLLLLVTICTFPLGSIIIFIVVTAGIIFYKTYDEENDIVRHFTREKFDPEYVRSHLAVPLTEEEAKTIPQDDQNLVVYGGFSPFVGAGSDLGGWSFAIDITRPSEDVQQVKSFDVHDLYAALDQTTHDLQFPNCLVREMFYVYGADLRDKRDILPDLYAKPRQLLADDSLKQYQERSDFSIRHYKWIAVRDWNDDLVVSFFLRCSIRGRNLFVEMNRFLLTPVKEQFRQIDALPHRGLRGNLALAASSLITGPVSAFTSALILLRRSPNSDKKQQEEITANPFYNYGTFSSLREASMSSGFSRYFQKLDHQMYTKIFDREILNTIVDFLQEHDVDISDVKEGQTTILNQGILVKGGNIQAESVAAGSGATAVTNRLSNLLGGSKEKTS